VIDDFRHFSLAPPQGFGHDADKIIRAVDNHLFDRFHPDAVYFA
jgi:hypothetical protein